MKFFDKMRARRKKRREERFERREARRASRRDRREDRQLNRLNARTERTDSRQGGRSDRAFYRNEAKKVGYQNGFDTSFGGQFGTATNGLAGMIGAWKGPNQQGQTQGVNNNIILIGGIALAYFIFKRK